MFSLLPLISWRRLVPLVGLVVGPVLGSVPAHGQDPTPQAAAFSTYLGGAGLDAGQVLAADAAGNLYVGGYTSSSDFPGTMAGQAYRGGDRLGTDAYLAKFNPAGGLVYTTLLGGSGDESITALAVDDQGRVVAAGITTSPDFPVVSALHAYRGGLVAQTDGFVVRLSADGTTVEAGTYLGGSGDDLISDLALDPEGRVVLVGTTLSLDLPTSLGALQPRHAGGVALQTDAFVARLRFTEARPALDYLTYLGGRFDEVGTALAVDADGQVVLAGFTNATDFPTAHAVQPTFAGPMRALEGDVFVAQLDSTGQQLTMGTYLGGARDDQVTSLALDADGRLLLTGWTTSRDFPVTPDALQPMLNGDRDAFLAVLVPVEDAPWTLAYATYFGGSGTDQAYRVAVDADRRIVLAGRTASDDLPVQDPVQAQPGGGVADGFVTRLSADGRSLDFASYLGGSGVDVISGLAPATADRVCVAGGTGSADFLLVNPTQTLFEGTGSTEEVDQSAFLACFGPGDFATAAEAPLTLPTRFALHPNYPNPFNPATTIRFEVPVQSPVLLEVFDVLGRRVATIVRATYAPGQYHVTLDARQWASGMYFYRLQAGRFVATRKMVLVK